jgi:hypothetical protein
VHPPNVVLYPDAFTGVQATVRYTYARDFFEQDVILLERLELPAGFNPATTRLEVWTEVLDAPAATITARQVHSLTDDTIDFGPMRIAGGKAFTLEGPQGGVWSAPMCKTWTQVEGRRFLIEAVEYPAVQAQLNALPAPPQGAAFRAVKPDGRMMAVNAAGQRLFPALKQAARATDRMQMASAATVVPAGQRSGLPDKAANGEARHMASARLSERKGLVLDYSLVTTLTNFHFKAGATYFLSGNATLSGTNILEGGAVIKYTNGATLTLDGKLECRTDAYRPAIFTSWSDNTAGETITGSTGNPWTNYAGGALKLDTGVGATELKHLRISHASTAIACDYDSVGPHLVRHVQIVHCQTAFSPINTTLEARNVLVTDVDKGFHTSHYNATVRGEHLTLSRVNHLHQTEAGATLTLLLTNSLLVAVTNTGSYSGEGNAEASDPATIFQTLGAAAHYLAAGSTNRNAGTTNANPGLQTDLKQRTTYAPTLLTNLLATNTTLSPRAIRDIDLPDRGYHYDALDFVASGTIVTNATLTVLPGVALGARTLNSYGLGLRGGANLICEGTAGSLNRIVRYNTVQEQANTNWTEYASSGASVLTEWVSATPEPQARFRFTEWSVPAGFEMYHFWGYYGDVGGSHAFVDSRFHAGLFWSDRPTVNVTNCLFERTAIGLLENYDMSPTLRHCTLVGSDLSLLHVGSGTWTFRDNLFDGTTNSNVEGSFTNNFNAYTTNATRLTPVGALDVVLAGTDPNYQPGALGRHYLPAGSPLVNAGSTNAHLLGLWHYTTSTNQAPETNSVVDIGMHFPAAGTNGLALDSDGEGLFDYQEDANGDGALDTNETSLVLADTDGDTLTDYEEVVLIGVPRTHPLMMDTDADGDPDAAEDSDQDLITNWGELRVFGSNPGNAFSLNLASNGKTVNGDASFLCTAPPTSQTGNSRARLTGPFSSNFPLHTLIIVDVTGAFTYDILATTDLNIPFKLHHRGLPNQTNFQVVQPGGSGIYVAGWALDTDGDGLTDGQECVITRSILDKWDTDGDGMADGWEYFYGLNPTNRVDGTNDLDGDGITNLQEFLNEQQQVRPREPLGPSSRRTPLVISEIMYRPAAGQMEFIELYNAGHLAVDLGDYRLGGDISYEFPDGTMLQPGDSIAVYENQYLTTARLNDEAGQVRLRHKAKALLLEVNYRDDLPWPVSAGGDGHSIVLARPSYGEDNALAWTASDRVGGSPGSMDSNRFDSLRFVVINEFLAVPSGTEKPYIELYNHGNVAVDISDCYLSTNRSQLDIFRIPTGTMVPARGFVRFEEGVEAGQLPFRPHFSGGAIYFTRPALTRVIDAVSFPRQAAGTAYGRAPDGAPGVLPLSAQTPAAANAAPILSDIVINEIMYNPITGSELDEYVEFHNRSTGSVDLNGWQVHGVQNDNSAFVISGTAPVAAGSYLVIAKDPSQLFGKYPNLNANNTAANGYSGVLADSGERLLLFNPNSNLVDEVTYQCGGRWGKWSDGGGSSLELIDPDADNRLPSNWGDSDESAKSSFPTTHNVSFSGTIEFSDGSPLNTLELGLLNVGECLLDDVEIFLNPSGPNRVTNPGFNTDLNGWGLQGSHDQSVRVTSGGAGNGPCLHLRAAGRLEYLFNRVTNRLTTAFTAGNQATVRAKAKWLRGSPELVLRLRGNGLEASGSLVVPQNLGTPGLQNSRFAANAGPAVSAVDHQPTLPAASQPILVTARFHDPDGIASRTLKYRVEPVATHTAVTMTDDGSGGDAVAGDGVFTAKIPGQAASKTIAFFIEAADSAVPPLTSKFPNDAPARECHVRTGEAPSTQSFGAYRIWMTDATFNTWSNRSKIDSTSLDITYVSGSHRVIYNAGGAFAGSDINSQYYDSPLNNLCGYDIDLPGDDRFLGATVLALDFSGQDDTGQREATSYWLAEMVELPFNHQRFVHVIVNGRTAAQRPISANWYSSAAKIHRDSQGPGADFLSQWYDFPDGAGKYDEGDLYKVQVWRRTYFEGGLGSATHRNATLSNWVATGGAKHVPSYRWNWRKRAATTTANDFAPLFGLVDAVNTSGAGYIGNVEALVEVEQWARILAVERAIANIDSYGYLNGQNMFGYRPKNKDGFILPWNLLLFDVELGLGTPGIGPGPTAGVFDSINDPVLARIIQHTNHFQRAYWRGFLDLVNDDNGPMRNSKILPIPEANRAALTANGVNTTLAALQTMTNWIDSRKGFLRDELAGRRPQFEVTTQNNQTTTLPTFTVAGLAPVEVRYIYASNTATTVSTLLNPAWTTASNWTAIITLNPGVNSLVFRGNDRNNVFLQPNDTGNFTDNWTITRQ